MKSRNLLVSILFLFAVGLVYFTGCSKEKVDATGKSPEQVYNENLEKQNKELAAKVDALEKKSNDKSAPQQNQNSGSNLSNTGSDQNLTQTGSFNVNNIQLLTSDLEIKAGEVDYNYMYLKDTANKVTYIHKNVLVTMEYDAKLSIFGACGESYREGNSWFQNRSNEYVNSEAAAKYIFKPVPDGKYKDYLYCKNEDLIKIQFNLVQIHTEFPFKENSENVDRFKWTYIHLFNSWDNHGLCLWYYHLGRRSAFDPKHAIIINDGPIK